MVVNFYSLFGGVIVILLGALPRRARSHRREDIFTAAGFAIFIICAAEAHLFLIHLFPTTKDALLLRMDQAMGFDARMVMAFVERHHPLWLGFDVVYCSLSALIGLAWTLEHDRTMRLGAALGGVLCFPLYAAVPAVGPGWFNLATLSAGTAPRNCMPSMHLTWAILIAWNAKSRPLRIALWLYVGLIAGATIALGQHYLIDLLAAVPYSAGIQYVAARSSARRLVTATPQVPAES